MSKPFTKQRLQFSLSLLIILILFGCTAPNNPANNTDIDLAAMDAYIDPEIPENERNVMRGILNGLPEYARQDVIHVDDDGTVYTNRMANKGAITILHPTEKGDWVDQDGQLYPIGIPDLDARPGNLSQNSVKSQIAVTPRCELDGSGIEFRMSTRPGSNAMANPAPTFPSLVGGEVKIYIPSKGANTRIEDPSGHGCLHDAQSSYGETPYVYLGGWGGLNGNSRIDAGLQINCAYSTTGTYSNFTPALFFSKQKVDGTFTAVNDRWENRFRAGQTIQLTFYTTIGAVSGSITRFFIVTASGIPATGGSQIVYKTLTTPDNGWSITGSDNIISLSASIAQTPHAAKGDYHVSVPPNPLSKFWGIKFSDLKVISSPFASPNWRRYAWNGYS